MVAREGIGAGAVGRLIGWLAVPRIVTFPLLIAIGLGLGELAWRFAGSIKILAWVSGMASPFCMMCATAVWAMRYRIDDVVDTEQMSSSEYQRFERLVSAHRAKSTYWAACVALMALLASTPAVSSQLAGSVWHWMILSCGAASGCAVYAYLLACHWETQIQAYRNQQKLSDKQQREKKALMEEINAGVGLHSGRGWEQGPTFDPPTQHPH
jgi:hypothetical protein